MITVKCTECGKDVLRKPYHAAMTKNHFCGFACYAKWQSENKKGEIRTRVKLTCDQCGTEFEKVPSQIASHNFCSRDCYNVWRARTRPLAGENNPAWRGGHSEYRGPNWTAQRAAARERDHDTCQRCGATSPGLPVHHIKPFRLFDDYRLANALENLITLCAPCHGIVEQEFWREHPELIGLSPFQQTPPTIICRECGNEFAPRSSQTRVCDQCCTATCAYCGGAFYSRKAVHRKVKYCSRECRNADVAAHKSPRRKSSEMT